MNIGSKSVVAALVAVFIFTGAGIDFLSGEEKKTPTGTDGKETATGQEVGGEFPAISFSDGVRELLKNNANLFRSKATLLSFEALQQEAYGSAYPAFSFLTFAAPIFEAKGDALTVQRNYDKWGPFIYGETQMTLPVFAFGRIDNAKKAADLGMEAGKKLHESEINRTVFEYKKIFLSLILLKQYKSILDDGDQKIGEAIGKAEESYNTGTGKVKKKDLAMLKIFQLDLQKLQQEWLQNKQKAAWGLGHFLGRTEALDAADADFPDVEQDAPALQKLIEAGFKESPDYQALKAGLQARRYQVEMEKAGNLPVFFVAARASASYTNVRNKQDSPFASDPYNQLNGAVVAGAQWNLDWAGSRSRVKKAESELEQLQGRQKEATSGIPFLIRAAYLELEKTRNIWRLSQKKYKEASKWSLAEWTSYSAGVGDARDLLESLGAFFMARREMAEAEFNYCLAWASLALQVGRHSMLTGWVRHEE